MNWGGGWRRGESRGKCWRRWISCNQKMLERIPCCHCHCKMGWRATSTKGKTSSWTCFARAWSRRKIGNAVDTLGNVGECARGCDSSSCHEFRSGQLWTFLAIDIASFSDGSSYFYLTSYLDHQKAFVESFSVIPNVPQLKWWVFTYSPYHAEVKLLTYRRHQCPRLMMNKHPKRWRLLHCS